MWKWLRENIFVKDMFIYLFIAAVIFYIPAWGAVLLGVVTANGYFYAFSASYVLIWAGPFTPTIPAILAIAVFLKQVVKKVKE